MGAGSFGGSGSAAAAGVAVHSQAAAITAAANCFAFGALTARTYPPPARAASGWMRSAAITVASIS